MWLPFWLIVAAIIGLFTLREQTQGPGNLLATAQRGEQDLVMVIPAGEFTMGLTHSDAILLADHFQVPRFWFRREQPVHRVFLPEFLIDRYEVTNQQYQEFIVATGHPSPKDWSGSDYLPGRGNHPVVNVNREDAAAFCKWAGKRLPTEAEWEKAARGTTSWYYPWGNQFIAENVNTVDNEQWDTAPVGSFPLDKSPYGVMDMAGNVSEWVADEYDPYPGFPASWGELELKYTGVARGGNWRVSLLYARTTDRIPAEPSRGNPSQGFRCAISR